MQLIATYIDGNKRFDGTTELIKYNELHEVKHINLYEEITLSELIGLSKSDLIVTIEGDEDLYNQKLSKELDKQDNYLLLNNIYESPEKLLYLLGKEINTLVIQSTGIRIDEINKLVEFYKEKIKVYPKNLICVFGEEQDFLSELVTAGDVTVYKFLRVRQSEVFLRRWLGPNWSHDEE